MWGFVNINRFCNRGVYSDDVLHEEKIKALILNSHDELIKQPEALNRLSPSGQHGVQLTE
jgi:hypothetical protein